MDSVLDWDSDDLASVPGSAAGLLGDLGQVASLLCAFVFPSVKLAD